MRFPLPCRGAIRNPGESGLVLVGKAALGGANSPASQAQTYALLRSLPFLAPNSPGSGVRIRRTGPSPLTTPLSDLHPLLTMRRSLSLVIAAAALLVAGCSDDSTGAVRKPSLSFDYSGTQSGSYHAEGQRLKRDSLHEYVVAESATLSEHGPTLSLVAWDSTGAEWRRFHFIAPL